MTAGGLVVQQAVVHLELVADDSEAAAGAGFDRRNVAREKVDDVLEGAFLDDDPPIHVGFAEIELRIEQELAFDAPVRQPHGRARARPVTGKDMATAAGIDDRERSFAYETP